jgi:hypothetical protein
MVELVNEQIVTQKTSDSGTSDVFIMSEYLLVSTLIAIQQSRERDRSVLAYTFQSQRPDQIRWYESVVVLHFCMSQITHEKILSRDFSHSLVHSHWFR